MTDQRKNSIECELQTKNDPDQPNESQSFPTNGSEIEEEVGPVYLSKEKLFLGIYLTNQAIAGIPLGFVQGSLPILLVANGAKLSDLGFLSLCSYPLTFKFIFGPILDRFFSERIGKRMSYILPCLATILILSFWSAFSIDNWIQTINLTPLTLVGFFLVLAGGVLMISSDGYLMTIVAKDRRTLMPMLKFLGQTLGTALSYNLFIPLNSVEFCNNHIFSTPRDKPLLTYELFFILFAISLACYVAWVAFCVLKEPPTKKNFGSIFEIVRTVRGFWTNKNLFRCLVFFMIWRLGFAPLDNYLVPASIRGGFDKAVYINIQTMLFPVGIIASCLAGRYVVKSTQNQFELFYAHIATKIAVSLLSYWMLIEYDTPEKWQGAFWMMTLLSALDTIQDTLIFTSTGAFFARICDHRVGTTFLTVIFSVYNFGNHLPKTIMYYILTDDNWKTVTYIFWIYTIVILFMIIPETRRLSKLPLEEFDVNTSSDNFLNKRGNQEQEQIEMRNLD